MSKDWNGIGNKDKQYRRTAKKAVLFNCKTQP